MIRKTLDNTEIELFCDFHGHSQMKDIFLYGCCNTPEEHKFKERIFPM